MSDVFSSLTSSLTLGLGTLAITVPIGVGAAVWLEEYAHPGKLASLVEDSISALASVPSIVKGLFGFVVFIRLLGVSSGFFAASATLALVILPMVINTSRVALRDVAEPLREASFALGADRLSALRHVVLPMAMPGISRGVLLALACALGETAPLVLLGTVASGRVDVLPLSIFEHGGATPALFLLLALVLASHGAAYLLRSRYERRADRGYGRGSLE